MPDYLLPHFDFVYAFAFYFAFFVYVLVFRVLGGATPNGSFCKVHFLSFPLYLATRVGLAFYCPDITFNVFDVAIGSLVYFMIHYAIMINFIGLASRSVSSTLLVQMSQDKKATTWKALFSAYGGGKGFDFIKANRLENMVKYGLVEPMAGSDDYRASPFGTRFFLLTKTVLGIWGLSQIGEKRPGEKK